RKLRVDPGRDRKRTTRSDQILKSRLPKVLFQRGFCHNESGPFLFHEILTHCAVLGKSISSTLVPQRLARLQRVLNSFLRFLFPAQRLESLALQIEDVLLAHRSSRRHVSAAEHLGNLC